MDPVTIGILIGIGVLALVGIGVAIKKNIDCNNLQREIRELRTDSDERETNLGELRVRIENLGRDLERTRGKNDVSEDQVVRYQQQIQMLTTNLAERDARITELTTQVSNLEREVAEYQLDDDPRPSITNNRYTLSGIRSASLASPNQNSTATLNNNRR